jgi:hypothetical protein
MHTTSPAPTGTEAASLVATELAARAADRPDGAGEPDRYLTTCEEALGAAARAIAQAAQDTAQSTRPHGVSPLDHVPPPALRDAAWRMHGAAHHLRAAARFCEQARHALARRP